LVSIDPQHTGASFDAAQHHGDYNLYGVSLGQWQDGAHDRVALNPAMVGIAGADGPAATNPSAADFALGAGSPCINAGYSGPELVGWPSSGFNGQGRDAQPDIGAMEYLCSYVLVPRVTRIEALERLSESWHGFRPAETPAG
jgi:hypothetical protein